MTNILFDKDHINKFFEQNNFDILDRSSIPAFSDKVFLKLLCDKEFLMSHYYCEHYAARTILDRFEEVILSYHLFGIANIDGGPAFVLKPQLPIGSNSLTEKILTNCLVFVHEEIVFYILALAAEKLKYSEYDFTKIDALRDLEDPSYKLLNHKNSFDSEIRFLSYVNNNPRFDIDRFHQYSTTEIKSKHHRDNLPYFRNFE